MKLGNNFIMITTLIALLSVGSLLLVNAGKLAYYNDRMPVNHGLEVVPVSYYWPNEDVLPIDAPDAIHYPTWFQLPWKSIPLQPPEVDEELGKETLPPETESPPSTTTEDNTPEGRHLHQEKPHKHHHQHKHKHHKHKHHHHHHETTQSEELQNANVAQLKMVILQLEHKLQELKLQLFGSRALTTDAVIDNDDDSARFDEHSTNGNHEASEEMEPSIEDVSRVLTDTTPETEKDEGKILLEGNADKPTSELELEHREIEPNPFDNGRSLTENVQKWFEGLDLGKIAALPLEESVENEDVLDLIDVRGNFN